MYRVSRMTKLWDIIEDLEADPPETPEPSTEEQRDEAGDLLERLRTALELRRKAKTEDQ